MSLPNVTIMDSAQSGHTEVDVAYVATGHNVWGILNIPTTGAEGFTPRKTVTIEYRWADEQFDRLAGFAAEFVQRGVDVIVAGDTVTTLAA
jgi:hypothetical protein